MRHRDPRIRAALDQIAEADERNRLRPEGVVDHARSPESALHACFTWDDRIAGEQYRLVQARHLISQYYVVLHQEPTPVVARAYVSLKSVRVQGGGYTPIRRVLSEPELHAEMLRNAREDLDAMERRYGHLQELKPLFAMWQRVRRRVAKEKHPNAAA